MATQHHIVLAGSLFDPKANSSDSRELSASSGFAATLSVPPPGSKTGAHSDSSDARSRPCDERSYNGLTVRFSATVGEEPDVTLGWSSGQAFVPCSPNCIQGAFSDVRHWGCPGGG